MKNKNELKIYEESSEKLKNDCYDIKELCNELYSNKKKIIKNKKI